MRAQISIEMILVLAAILAIAFILVTQLQSVAQQGTAKINETSMKIIEEASVCGISGDPCTSDEECCSGSCVAGTCE